MTARSHGSGRYAPADLGSLGEGTVIEEGVLVFNAAHVHIGREVYIGRRDLAGRHRDQGGRAADGEAGPVLGGEDVPAGGDVRLEGAGLFRSDQRGGLM